MPLPQNDAERALRENASGRDAYEGFSAAMSPWLPPSPDWNALSAIVQKGWIAAAKAVLENRR
jgi:hypothetical protein